MDDKAAQNMVMSVLAVGGGYATVQAFFGDKKNKLWSEVIQNFASGLVVGGVLVAMYVVFSEDDKKRYPKPGVFQPFDI